MAIQIKNRGDGKCLTEKELTQSLETLPPVEGPAADLFLQLGGCKMTTGLSQVRWVGEKLVMLVWGKFEKQELGLWESMPEMREALLQFLSATPSASDTPATKQALQEAAEPFMF